MATNSCKLNTGFWYVLSLIILVGIDRFTKQWALIHLATHDINIIPGLRLVLVKNRGITWGLLGFEQPMWYALVSLIVAAIVICLALYIYYEYRAGNSIMPEVMMFAGAASNLYDRIMYGGVIDFIELYIKTWSWPVFNVADMLLVCGVFLLLLRTWKRSSS